MFPSLQDLIRPLTKAIRPSRIPSKNSVRGPPQQVVANRSLLLHYLSPCLVPNVTRFPPADSTRRQQRVTSNTSSGSNARNPPRPGGELSAGAEHLERSTSDRLSRTGSSAQEICPFVDELTRGTRWVGYGSSDTQSSMARSWYPWETTD